MLTIGENGITPACAGNRNTSALEIANLKDHPRVCGEQLMALEIHPLQIGSPPRVRGTARAAGSQAQGHRITPACAGNRCPRRRPWKWGWDHPRVCGEQLTVWQKMRDFIGSPPRVRGTGKY